MIKLIIFDYDGVIVDSFSNVFKVHKIICKELKKELPDTPEEFKKTYGQNYLECYKNLGIESREEHIKANEIFERELIKLSPKLFKGVKEVLEKLNKKYKLVLVSANFKEEVLQKIKEYGLEKYFLEIATIKKIPGSNPIKKSVLFKKMMKNFGFSPEETLVIGDREGDFNEAEKAEIKHKLLVEYGWGYNPDNIEGFNQKIRIKTPYDIIKAVEELDKNQPNTF